MWLDYMEPRFRDRALCIIPNEEGVEILALGGQESPTMVQVGVG
jgi:hypothetical protein